MNRGKEPVNQRTIPSSLRISSEESTLPKPKKLNTRGEGASPKHSPQKESENFFSRPVPVKLKSRQSNTRAQSVEKLPPPQNNDLKSKAIINVKVSSRGSGMPRQPNKPVKTPVGENRQFTGAKSASPNKERAVKEASKVKENVPRKDTLEVVSEENEEHFRETLQSLTRKDSDSRKSESNGKSVAGPIELIFDEYNLTKGRAMLQKKGEDEGKSPKRDKKELTVETVNSIKFGESPDSPTEEMKYSSQVRGAFTKEHVLPEVRQKAQDQKKLMREYLDSQLDEKRRLKEEEKLRRIEENKREEARLRREVDQMNKQYERETSMSSMSKGRVTEMRTESPAKEARVKHVVKRESPELKKLDHIIERESSSELGSQSRKSLKFKTLRDESLLKKEIEDKIMEFHEHGEIKKLAEENEQLRSQNLRKNELIDILLTALKNTGQDGPASADQLRYTPGFSQSRAKSRTVHDKMLIPAKTVENLDSPLLKKQETLLFERNNTSPWSNAGSTYYAGLRSETDPDTGLEEPSSPMSTGPQSHTYRASENLSRLINPNIHTELKLPVIPDFYSHRKGYSAMVDQSSSMKNPTYLSRSGLQAPDSQSSSRIMNTPLNNKISPRQFSLNITSPSSAMILKPKSEIMTTSVTPTIYSRQITHYGRLKQDGSLDAEVISMGGRSTVDIDSQRMVPSISQLSVRKGREGNLPPAFNVPSSPFRNSTNVNQRGMMDSRSPIRVVDMGTGHQRAKVEHKLSIEEPRVYPRFKDEFTGTSVRDGVKSVRSLDHYLEKGDIELDGDKRMDSFKKSKFPKEVFCLNLRKKVGV